MAYNNERGGVIESLKNDSIVDLDSYVHTLPEWLSTKAMVSTWLADAVMYELWVGSDGSSAHKIYYADLPWPIGKILFFKQVHVVKQLLGINKDNADRTETEVISYYIISLQFQLVCFFISLSLSRFFFFSLLMEFLI